jgi:ADP-dependent NAD(P)H-hydrate dehydratase / NAD(P)H-hydrate epimerase
LKPVLTVGEMRAADARALESTSQQTLVARAGTAVAREALAMLGGAYGRRVIVVAGKGNNGADGRVAAGVLTRRGARVVVYPPAGAPRALPACDLVIDAALGTGFHGEYIAPVPAASTRVLAVDIPSGVDGDTGEACAGAARADATVTFVALKPGLLLGDGPDRAGPTRVSDIGIDAGTAHIHLVEDGDVARFLPARRRQGHKWDAAVYIAAGSPGMLGAPTFSVRGALRSGAGMVRLGVPGLGAGELPVSEAVGSVLPAEDWAVPVLDDLSRCKALVVGPGLGTGAVTTAAVRRLVTDVAVPMVIDADGLTALGTVDEASPLFARRRAPTVLTPHDGEFARLLGALPGHDRIASALELARLMRAVVLLKGPTTVVAAPSGQVLLSASGSSALSTAGTGDVLSGIIGAFCARGVEPFLAAGLAAHVHGRASGRGALEGLVAGDLPGLVSAELSSLRASAERSGA